MKKKLLKVILLFTFTIAAVYGQKVKTIEDKFYGTRYYQTSWVKHTFLWGGGINLRLRTPNGLDKIFLEAQLVYTGTYTTGKNDAIIIRFDDNTTLELSYENTIPDYKWGKYASTYTSYALADVSSYEKMKKIVAIRIETSEGFNNIEIKESFAQKIITSFDNIRAALEKDSSKVKE